MCGRKRRVSTSVLALVLFALEWHDPAVAGAFNLPQGQGLAIIDATLSGGSRYFNGLGKLAPADKFTRGDLSAYLEYGVTDWLMAVVRPDLTAVSLGGHPGSSYVGLGPSEAGAQLRLLLFGPAVLAAKASVRLPGSTDQRNPAQLGNTSRDADLRGLFGLSFKLGPWPAFLDSQAAYRFRDGGAPDEAHVDVTLGVRPRSDLLVLLQSFTTVGLGPGTWWFPREDFTHVEVAGVYDINQQWSVELGVYTTILGRRSLREQGVTTAVWRRF